MPETFLCHGIGRLCRYPRHRAWPDCRDARTPGGDPYTFFLDKARVALNDGRTFGTGGDGFVRLNFACPRPLLMDGLARMRAALSSADER